MITGDQEGTDGAGATQTHEERVRSAHTIPTALIAAPPSKETPAHVEDVI